MEKSGAQMVFEAHVSHNVTDDGRIEHPLTPLRRPGPEVSGHDPLIEQAVEILNTGAQRQDSALDQIKDLRALAIAAGCYDADEILRQHLDTRAGASRQRQAL